MELESGPFVLRKSALDDTEGRTTFMDKWPVTPFYSPCHNTPVEARRNKAWRWPGLT
jgi:hypothetical protein